MNIFSATVDQRIVTPRRQTLSFLDFNVEPGVFFGSLAILHRKMVGSQKKQSRA